MSILSSIEGDLSKAEKFLISIFTKTNAVLAVISKVSPQTLAAMLAVFYDLLKFITAGGSIVSLFTAGNFTAGINGIFSPTTQALLTNLENDIKTADTVILADVSALDVAVKTAAPTS